jgi:hypothetical protein
LVIATGVVVPASATGRAEAERIVWEAGTSRVAAAETGMLSEAVPEAPTVTADRAHAPAAAAVLRVWAPEEGEEEEVVVAGDGGGKWPRVAERIVIGACI